MTTKLVVRYKVDTSIEILDILNQQEGKRMRITPLLGLMQFNGHANPTTYYHINKLIKWGFIRKITKSRLEKYLQLSNLVPLDYMKGKLRKEGHIMCDYETFLMHLKQYPDGCFTRPELEEHIRSKIHDGFSAGNFRTWYNRAQKEGIIGNTRQREKVNGPHMFMVMPIEPSPKQAPTLASMYERIIVKIFKTKENREMFWTDFKKEYESIVGIPLSANKKAERAIRNMAGKKYLLLDTKNNKVRYYLNPLFNFG